LGSGFVRIYGSLQFYRPIEPSSSYSVVDVPELVNNPEKYNGSYVRVPWAQVIQKDEEAKTIKVYSNGSYISVYVRDGVRYYDDGDYVEIQGKFVNYHGVWEISVSGGNDFVSEPKWEIIAGTSYQVLEKKSYERNDSLVEFSFREVEGVVVDYRIYTYSAVLTLWSDNQSYSIYIESNRMVKDIDYGDKVIVRGIVTFYQGEPEIKVRPFTNDMVEVIS
jgi:DNA/RNA endonuclease YhcR with UshA esterase domain